MATPDEILSQLDRRDLNEVRSFAKPPQPVMTVVKAVCILLGDDVTKYQWKDCSRVLLDHAGLVEKLEDCDPTPEAVQGAKEMLGDLTKEKAMMCSRAAGVLYNWCRAVIGE